MGQTIKPSPPQTPNAGALNAGQFATDVGTATANAWMQNANVNTPMGNVTYQEGAGKVIQVPVFGPDGQFAGMQNFTVPTFTRNETLAPAQQQMLNQQNQLGINLNNVALNQTDKIGGILNSPVSSASLPARTNSYGANPALQNVGSGPSLARTETTVADTGAAQRSFADTGGAVQGFDQTGGAARFAGETGYAQRTMGDVGTAQRNLADAGTIQRSIGPTDYAAQRASVEDAIYSRLNPQLDRDRAALETKLVNQGLVRGTTAFNTAMDEANRQATDARMQAVLAGGQEQSRLAGLDLQKGQFANQAEEQAYNQILGRGQFYNQGQEQDFGQMAQRAALYNVGQSQDLAQAMQRAGLYNQGAAQDLAQLQARAGFFNAGQAQNFAQAQARAQFYNQGQEQDFGQTYQRGLFGLQATDQNNQAAQQEYENQTSATGANNQVAQQQFGNTQAQAQFGNENRDKALQELFALRNQPINEISALMSGGQVSLPQFQQYNPGTVANNNLGANMYNAAALNMDAYKTKQATTNALIGALGGAAGAGLYGLGKKYG